MSLFLLWWYVGELSCHSKQTWFHTVAKLLEKKPKYCLFSLDKNWKTLMHICQLLYNITLLSSLCICFTAYKKEHLKGWKLVSQAKALYNFFNLLPENWAEFKIFKLLTELVYVQPNFLGFYVSYTLQSNILLQKRRNQLSLTCPWKRMAFSCDWINCTDNFQNYNIYVGKPHL